MSACELSGDKLAETSCSSFFRRLETCCRKATYRDFSEITNLSLFPYYGSDHDEEWDFSKYHLCRSTRVCLLNWINTETCFKSFIEQERILIEKKGAVWVNQEFNRELLFEKFITLNLEAQIVYYFCYISPNFLVSNFKKDYDEKSLFFYLNEEEKEKKLSVFFKKFFEENKEKILEELENEEFFFSNLELKEIRTSLDFRDSDNKFWWELGESANIISCSWTCFSDNNLPFPRLPNYMQTDEIKFFLAEKLEEAKILYYRHRFQEEKKELLKTLDQKEKNFLREIRSKITGALTTVNLNESLSFDGSNLIIPTDSDEFFRLYKLELQTDKSAFSEEEKLEKNDFWSRLYKYRDWRDPETKEIISYTSREVFFFYVKELKTGKMSLTRNEVKTPKSLFQIAFKKLAKRHGPTSEFFRKYILNICFITSKVVPEEAVIPCLYSKDPRLCLTREGMWSLETDYQINQRKEKMFFHFAWCQTCLRNFFYNNNPCPFENSEMETKAKNIFVNWKAKQNILEEKELAGFNDFLMECTIKRREYRQLEITQFREGKLRGEIIISFGLDFSKINQGYLNYLERLEEIKEAAFFELNEPELSEESELSKKEEVKKQLSELELSERLELSKKEEVKQQESLSFLEDKRNITPVSKEKTLSPMTITVTIGVTSFVLFLGTLLWWFLKKKNRSWKTFYFF